MMNIIHDFELDIRSEVSPYPLLRTKQLIDKIKKGEIVKVIVDNPVSLHDIVTWIKDQKNQNELLSVEVNCAIYTIFIRKS